jgi:hypothetical protein
MTQITSNQRIIISQIPDKKTNTEFKLNGLIADTKSTRILSDNRPKPKCDIYIKSTTTVTKGSEKKCYPIGGCETSHFLNFNTKVIADIIPKDTTKKIDENAKVEINFDEARVFGINGNTLKRVKGQGKQHLEYDVTERQNSGNTAPARETDGFFYVNELFGKPYYSKLVPYIHGSCNVGGFETEADLHFPKPTK